MEKILNQAVKELQNGSSKNEVLSKWPQFKNELAPLLSLAERLNSLPKKTVPEPAMQRKYILAPSKTFWLRWIHVSRLASVSIGMLLLAATLGSTGYAAEKSLPGTALFKVKKIAEHLQLQLTLNQEDKINFQVSLAQKRLNDAQTIINNSESAPEQKTAALNELAEETKNTVTVLNQSDKTLAPVKNHPLIASLDSISSQQQALISNVNTQKTDKEVQTATQANATQVAAIQQYLNSASKEQALTDLASNPAALSEIGLVEQISKTSITVNKQVFNLSERTLLKDEKGLSLPAEELKLGKPVEILGDKNNSGNFARQITILSETTYKGKVKGEQTLIPSSTANPTSTPAANEDIIPAKDPNSAIGTFIPEDPSPQTDFK